MKKLTVFLLALSLMFSLSVFSFAEENKDENTPEQAEKPPVVETTQDMSTPRLMVTSYSLDTKELTAGKSSVLKITFQNYSNSKALNNIKLSVLDESGQIEIDGMGTKFQSIIYAGGTLVWEVKLTALSTAEIGRHKLTVTSEYEDKYFTPYSSSDTLALTVKQSVAVDQNGISMPEKIVEGETNTMTVTVMNTGKTDIRNCKLTFVSETLESSGTTFVGEIPAGESKEAKLNYKQPTGKLGEVKATVELSFDDAFGNTDTKKYTVSSTCEKKVEVAEKTEDEEKKNSNKLWWLFILLGSAVGGVLGYGIPAAIRSKKQRKEDELRL